MKREIDWQSCYSMSAGDVNEYAALDRWCDMLHQERGRDLRIIEIGSYQGRSATMMAQYGTVMCIDLFGDIGEGTTRPEYIGRGHFTEYIANIERLGLVDRVFPLVGTSDCLNFFPDLYADIVFVDGSHYYEPVKKDIWNVLRHLNSAGLLCFHDFKRPSWGYPPIDGMEQRSPVDPWWGVAKAVDEFLQNEEFEIFEKVEGIVSIRKRGS